MTVFKEKLLEIHEELGEDEGLASEVIDNTQIWLLGLNLQELLDLKPQSNILGMEIAEGLFELDYSMAYAIRGFIYLIMKEQLNRRDRNR